MTLPVIKTERLYRQIANVIMAGITRGDFVAGGLLPPGVSWQNSWVSVVHQCVKH